MATAAGDIQALEAPAPANNEHTSQRGVSEYSKEQSSDADERHTLRDTSRPESSSTAPPDTDRAGDVEKGVQQPDGAEEKPPPADPNIVDFDGPDDPANPLNWPASKKWSTVAILSFLTLVTPLASSMVAPGVPQILQEFQSDNQLLEALVVSVYVLGYACGPLFIAPLSELYGRMPLYHATNALYVIFTIACAVSSNLNMLIGFRFLAGIAGSGPLTMGSGTIADMFRQEERARAMSLWSMGPLIGPVAGPIGGGFLTQAKGWRWVFWVIVICSGFVVGMMFIILRESYATIILEKKAKRLRKETGNQNLRSKFDQGLTPGKAFSMAIVRPTKMLFLSPIVFLLSTFTAVVYGYLYLLFTTTTLVFEGEYGFSQGTVGLSYVGIGVGMFIGLGLFGGLSDRLLKAQAGTGEMKPEYRLPFLLPGSAVVPIGLFLYGWSAQYRVHWIVPIIGTSFVGLGTIGTFMPILTYLVDAFPMYAASATAANTIWRSIVGAFLPLAGLPMYSRLGLGWGNSLLGFISIAMLPIPLLLTKYGERIRTSPKFQLNL